MLQCWPGPVDTGTFPRIRAMRFRRLTFVALSRGGRPDASEARLDRPDATATTLTMAWIIETAPHFATAMRDTRGIDQPSRGNSSHDAVLSFCYLRCTP
jgi:hypothetical protein